MTTNGQTVSELHSEIARLRQQVAELEQQVTTHQTAHRECQELLAAVIKHNPSAISVFDSNLHYMLVSDRYLQDYEIADQGVVVGRHHYEVFPEMPQRWRDVHSRCLEGAVERSDEDSFEREDGSITYNRWECRPWYDAHGSIGGLVMFTEVITERKQLERQLRAFHALVENAPDMIGMATLNGQITYANPAYRNGLGFAALPEKFTIIDCIAQESREHVQKEVLPAMMQQGAWQGIIPFQRGDDSTFPVQTTGFLVRDEQGQPLAFASISRDITEQQRTEEKLRISQTLIENAPDAIGVADLSGTIFYGNQAFCELFQIESFDNSLTITDIVVPAEREQHIQTAVKQTFEQGVWKGEVTYQRMDGMPIPGHVSAFCVRDSDEQNIAVAAIIRDMTEQKRAEQRQTRLSSLVETSSDFIAFTSPDGREAYVNTAGRALVGLDADRDINAVPMTDYHLPEDTALLQQTILPAVMEQGIWKGEFRFRHFKTGQSIPASYAIFQIKDPMTNEITALGCVARDIREQKKQEAEHAALQQQVIEAQRSALRELSTPLIPITDNVVIMPLIGTIDSGRAQQVMEALLEGVAQYQAELAIIDITGVSVVDTQVAQALVSAAQAVRLLGAQVMLTGIQPQIAQTLVHLGIDLSTIQTRGNLQTGIAAALSKK